MNTAPSRPVSVSTSSFAADVLAASHRQPVLVDFWASWCGPCRQSFPWMNRMQSKFGPQGLRVVAVNLDSQPAEAQRFLAQWPAQFTLAFDPTAEAARRFGIKAMPSSVLLGADGKVVATHAGFRDDDIAPLEARIAAVLRAS